MSPDPGSRAWRRRGLEGDRWGRELGSIPVLLPVTCTAATGPQCPAVGRRQVPPSAVRRLGHAWPVTCPRAPGRVSPAPPLFPAVLGLLRGWRPAPARHLPGTRGPGARASPLLPAPAQARDGAGLLGRALRRAGDAQPGAPRGSRRSSTDHGRPCRRFPGVGPAPGPPPLPGQPSGGRYVPSSLLSGQLAAGGVQRVQSRDHFPHGPPLRASRNGSAPRRVTSGPCSPHPSPEGASG